MEPLLFKENGNWLDSIKAFADPRVARMLFLGFSAGIPILLIFSSLSLWLREAGVARATVTYFSWAALGYSFKFVWAPLVDSLPLPYLTPWLGKRRSWLLLSQCMIMLAIVIMAMTDPSSNDSLAMMAFGAVLLGFSSATQDIVIDAFRIESAEQKLQALMAATYVAGYRIGMIVAGAGALFLAAGLGSSKDSYSYAAWQGTYLIMAAVMLVGVVTTLLIPEPNHKQNQYNYTASDYSRFFALFLAAVLGLITTYSFSDVLATNLKLTLSDLSSNSKLASVLVEFLRLSSAVVIAWSVASILVSFGLVQRKMVVETYLAPVQDFFQRYGKSLAWLLLALIGLYRVSDIVLGVISNVFYQDLGFTKVEIGVVVKSFGLLMTILGGFLGGLLAMRFGVMRILFLGGVLSALTNLLFMLLAQAGHDMTLFYIVVSADNLAAGLASAAFIAFLSSLVNVSFTAMQYAIFSSLMTLLPKTLGGYSGGMVDAMGYQQFFLMTAVMGIPVLLVIAWASKRFHFNDVVIK